MPLRSSSAPLLISKGFTFGNPSHSLALHNFTLDFSSSAASYPGLTSVVTGTIYAQTSASVVASIALSGWENRGDIAGGGVWMIPSTTNLAPNPFDFRTSAGWTAAAGSITNSVSSVVAPDGSFCQKLLQPTTTYAEVNKTVSTTNAPVTFSVWYKWDATTPPTTQFAAFTRGTFIPGPTNLRLPNVGTLTRSTSVTQGAQTTAVGITPAGANSAGSAANADSGAIEAWGYSATNGVHDIPIVNGTASISQTLDQAHSKAIIDSGGNLELRVDFGLSTSTGSWNGETADFYLWSATTSEGLMAVRWTYNSPNNIGSWVLTVRGIDVLTVSDPSYLFSNPSIPGQFNGQWSSILVYYNISSGVCGIRIGVNGCVVQDATTSTTGSALIAPTTVYLGTNLGSSTNALVGRLRYIQRPLTRVASAPEFVIIGDSIMSSFVFGTVTLPPVGASIYTIAESYTRPGIGNLARSGYQTNSQQTLWTASTWKSLASVKAVLIQVGVNDLTTGNQTAAQTAARIQTLINTVKADQPTAKIILAQLTPSKTWLTTNFGASYYTRWQVLNTDIAGTGPNPITGADSIIMHDNTSALNNGSDDLVTTLGVGDGVHTNAAGRAVNAAEFRTALISLGLL